jgi:hypothetical protein
MGQDIRFGKHLLETLGKLAKQAISGLVSERLIDAAESLKVEDYYRKRPGTALERTDALIDPIQK